MSVESDKAVVAAYVDAFNRGDFEAIRPLFTDDAIIYGVAGQGPFDAVLPIWNDLHRGMAMTLEVLGMVAADGVVAVRYRERGRWVGPFLGRQGATGRPYEVAAMEWFEMRDGRIARRWGARDSAAIARQTGMAA